MHELYKAYERFRFKEIGLPLWFQIKSTLSAANPTISGGIFRGIGQDVLRRVLRAYALTHPAEGYCQGQAPVAATLLMNMPEAQAFHCLQQICHHYLQGYYSPGLQVSYCAFDLCLTLYRWLKSRTLRCFELDDF